MTPSEKCEHVRTVNLTGGSRCADCGKQWTVKDYQGYPEGKPTTEKCYCPHVDGVRVEGPHRAICGKPTTEKCSCNITQACPKCSDCVCGSAWCEIHSGPKPQPTTEKCSCDPKPPYNKWCKIHGILAHHTNISKHEDESLTKPTSIPDNNVKDAADIRVESVKPTSEPRETNNRPKRWWAIFPDYRDLSSGVLQSKPWGGGSNMTSDFEVVSAYEYDDLTRSLEDAKAEFERLMRLMKPALDEASFLRGLVKEDEEIETLRKELEEAKANLKYAHKREDTISDGYTKLRLKSEKLLEALKFVETQTEQSESSVAVVIWERARKAIAEWEK